LAGEFLAEPGQLAEQVDQAALLGAVQAVVRRVEIADQRPGERFPQDPDEDIATAVAVDEEHRQARVAEAPGPGGVAVDPPAGLVPLDHGGSTEQFQEFVDHWGEELTAPAEVTEQAGSADGQAEEVVEQVAGLAQGDAEVGPAGAGGRAGRCARPVVPGRRGPGRSADSTGSGRHIGGSDAIRSWAQEDRPGRDLRTGRWVRDQWPRNGDTASGRRRVR